MIFDFDFRRDRKMKYLAHSENQGGRYEPLAEHLIHVARKCQEFATPFGAGEQGFAAGILHDLGKYSERFLARLQGEAVSLDHWTIGALACACWSKSFGLAPALAVLGHHVGLQTLPASSNKFAAELDTSIQDNLARHSLADLAEGRRRLEADGLALPKLTNGFRLSQDAADLAAAEMLDVRMLFSALVDADFLETEAHFSGDQAAPRRPRPAGPALDVPLAWEALQAQLSEVRSGSNAAPLREIRERLFTECLQAGESSATGAFTLTAPTGTGKTLAMLGFALAHARRHRLRRIVIAMPFLNIVDQTAQQYCEMYSAAKGFAENFVLEQHSLVEDAWESSAGELADGVASGAAHIRRLLAENWDAPILLTTTVQLLESLHANKPSRCRKLHRLAESVILLDEAQTLPPKLAAVTLATLSRLSDPAGPYRSSAVFATATQPAFETLQERVKQYYRVGWQPREIVQDPPALFAATNSRTRVEWRNDRKIALNDLAAELADLPRVLAIVNLKRHATALARELQERAPEGLYHLSTNMCPAHREATLREIRARLDDLANPVTRVIATQCVEAGVDLDFRPVDLGRPVLYRALAPLDAIAQAAGRANRHGRSATATVVVFEVDDSGRTTFPPGYGDGIAATKSLLQDIRHGGVHPDSLDLIHDPEWIRKYYRQLYCGTGRDEKALPDEKIDRAVREGNFVDVAASYRLIESDAINIVVPYDRVAFDELRREISAAKEMSADALRAWRRRARKHSVAIFRPPERSTTWSHLDPIAFSERELATNEAQWFWPLPSLQYENGVGLVWPDENELIV
jgi:CRISPR-associated helicase Cas3/CRISPR-associated endonuclease Cas3-HD